MTRSRAQVSRAQEPPAGAQRRPSAPEHHWHCCPCVEVVLTDAPADEGVEVPTCCDSHLVKNSGHGRSGTVAHGQGPSTCTRVSPRDRRQPSLARLRASAGRHLYQHPAKERHHLDAGHRVVAVVAGWQYAPDDGRGRSPWIDARFVPLERDLLAQLDAQEHRRYIKTHSPADCVPIFEECKYITVYRDGRDALMSWANHRGAMRSELVDFLNASALDEGLPPLPSWDGDMDELFDQWATDCSPDHPSGVAVAPAQRRFRLLHALQRSEGRSRGRDETTRRLPRHRGSRGPLARSGQSAVVSR